MSSITGQCNCGGITVTVPKDKPNALCPRLPALSASGNLVVDPSELKVTGQPKMYQTEGLSGGEVYRYFCGTCGSGIYTGLEAGSPAFVKAGLFDIGDIPKPSVELFCRNLAAWEQTYPEAQRKDTQ
ncbi:hypothetical protein EHS25_005299 [Saitozyma podzolica]|uniref:CENP-V/GFA domain-containing protein n=1 Tax=Saitozyma podzolica TaxID=1890683 RepID=A0A427XYT5_9TREE|nr:hypothetical protein EHS25_005299 [Saitozyma podzolica]